MFCVLNKLLHYINITSNFHNIFSTEKKKKKIICNKHLSQHIVCIINLLFQIKYNLQFALKFNYSHLLISLQCIS